MGGVAAASGALELIARPGGFGGTAEGFQPYSAEVGASVTDQGYTLTLDGIGVDEALLPSTPPSPEKSRSPWGMTGGEPTVWPLNLRARAGLEFWGRGSGNRVGGRLYFKVIQRCPVARALPDVVELQVYRPDGCYGLYGVGA